MKTEITQDLLQEYLAYSDGTLTWKKRTAPNKAIGKRVGSVSHRGYRKFCIFGVRMYEHRAIFMFFNGYMPEQVDHIDGDTSNNRIENLRAATNQTNSFNSKLYKNNTSGIKGVHWDRSRDKWAAQIMIDGKCIGLGRFEDKNDACVAVSAARQKLHREYGREL